MLTEKQSERLAAIHPSLQSEQDRELFISILRSSTDINEFIYGAAQTDRGWGDIVQMLMPLARGMYDVGVFEQEEVAEKLINERFNAGFVRRYLTGEYMHQPYHETLQNGLKQENGQQIPSIEEIREFNVRGLKFIFNALRDYLVGPEASKTFPAPLGPADEFEKLVKESTPQQRLKLNEYLRAIARMDGAQGQ